MDDNGQLEAKALRFLEGEARDILKMLAATDVEELEMERGGVSLTLRRTLAASEPAAQAPPLPLEQPAAAPVEDSGLLITSPVVGWFRRSAQPQGPPLVEAGQSIEPGQRLAVIEAVQIVHDVLADRAGVIINVLAADGQGVGYGDPLFRIREPR